MITKMNYQKAKKWIISEKGFDSNFLGKCEAIMCLGNGYMGLRSSTEESYLNERRNLFVAGTFNKANENEVTELPNVADLIAMELVINGEVFNLEKGKIKSYLRELNIKTGELERKIIWISPKKDEIELNFKRIVSFENLHTIAQKVVVKSLSSDIKLKVNTGINGRMTNSGAQHFIEGDKRLFHKKYMQYVQTTTESKIDFVLNTAVTFLKQENEISVKSRIVMERRKIFNEYITTLNKGEELVIEKISNVFTSRDLENKDLELEGIQKKSLEDIMISDKKGYDFLANESANALNDKVWNKVLVEIESENEFDQLAIRFAQYHLAIMTPAHDNRMNIGAKGLSGEGYKGHTFWDTEIFILPYFTFTNPEVARKLEEYRYLSLKGAHNKAKENGYEGAQFPWESAWLDDGEVTPVWGAADIYTGLPTKIWSGFIEQHITSDVAYGVWQYFMTTGDQKFMDSYGYELLLDTAKFWSSRLEYSEEDKLYHINDVVGADEYKEHVNDNAFTNYMAYWNIKKAINYYDMLKEEKKEIFEKLNKKLELDRVYKLWMERVNLIYLPQPRESDNVIPQDSTYLDLANIDLTKYKKQTHVGSIFNDYNLEQVNKIQVSKQADIMMLFYLMEDLFTLDVKRANWNYYEPRTLHDSSLSLSTHCILANDMGDKEMAYKLFERASRIDLGENMKTSDDGIHAASIGGIWQSVVFGFAGVRMLNGELRINPSLPEKWSNLKFSMYWKGQQLIVNIDKEKIIINNVTNKKEINLKINNKDYTFKENLAVQF